MARRITGKGTFVAMRSPVARTRFAFEHLVIRAAGHRRIWGQRVESAVAPTLAPALAPAPTPTRPLRDRNDAVFRTALGANWDGHRVTGEGGATPSFERFARPGCAQRARSAGSLPLRPCVLRVNAKRRGLDHGVRLVGVDSLLEVKRLSNSVQPPSRPRLCGRTRHRQGSPLRSDPFGARNTRGLDRASVRPRPAHA